MTTMQEEYEQGTCHGEQSADRDIANSRPTGGAELDLRAEALSAVGRCDPAGSAYGHNEGTANDARRRSAAYQLGFVRGYRAVCR
jgi:hypothetical protein